MVKAKAETLNIGYYLSAISQRRWFMIIPFCLAMIVGIVLAVKLPKIYEASTLILVQPQRVPEKIVTPVVSSDFLSRINTLSLQIMSRSNLERIIDKFQLFGDQPQRGMLNEEKIEIIRKKVKVDMGRTGERKDTNTFSISFLDEDPLIAMRVANGLAESFIEENLRLREDQAVGTTDFLEAELKTMRKRLEEVEQSLSDFRGKHKGMLPEELEANLRLLDRLNAQLGQKEENLRSMRTSLVALEAESSARLSEIRAASRVEAAKVDPIKTDDEKNPTKLREKLSEMMLRYTEQHPDVIRLRLSIEKLEAELAAKPDSRRPQLPATSPPPTQEAPPAASLNIRQRIELSGAIKSAEADIVKLKQSIEEYQKRVEETSKYGQEMMNLQRDYDNMRESYNSLLNRKLEADIAVNLEKKQKGEQFMIIDKARLPEKPVSPKMPQLFMITIAAGLGFGAALIFLLEMMDVSVRRLDKLEEEIGLPVLTMVPRIFTSKDRQRHRMVMAATTVSIVVALALAGVFALLVFHGVEPTLELVGYYSGT
jgi:polysaccharide chain length determinant protein (PEP-CTERM system associated)